MEARGVLTVPDLVQISEFGHNPIQLFDKEHEQSLLNSEIDNKHSQIHDNMNLSNKLEYEKTPVIRIIVQKEASLSIIAINTSNEVLRKQYILI